MNKINVKALQWESENDGVIFTSPEGFDNAYFITAPNKGANESNKFELALIDKNGTCDESTTTMHETEYSAKLEAQEIFTSLVLKHVEVL